MKASLKKIFSQSYYLIRLLISHPFALVILYNLSFLKREREKTHFTRNPKRLSCNIVSLMESTYIFSAILMSSPRTNVVSYCIEVQDGDSAGISFPYIFFVHSYPHQRIFFHVSISWSFQQVLLTNLNFCVNTARCITKWRGISSWFFATSGFFISAWRKVVTEPILENACFFFGWPVGVRIIITTACFSKGEDEDKAGKNSDGDDHYFHRFYPW